MSFNPEDACLRPERLLFYDVPGPIGGVRRHLRVQAFDRLSAHAGLHPIHRFVPPFHRRASYPWPIVCVFALRSACRRRRITQYAMGVGGSTSHPLLDGR